MRIALVIAGAVLAGLTGASALSAPTAPVFQVGNRRQTVRFGVGKRCV